MTETLIEFPFKNFTSRVTNSMTLPSLFVLMLTTVMYLKSSSGIALLIGLLIFIYYLVEQKKWNRVYITQIKKLSNDIILIIYFDKDEKKEYQSKISLLTIDKEFVWYKIRGRQPLLTITNLNDNFKIKQYSVVDWTESIIDNFISSFNSKLRSLQPT